MSILFPSALRALFSRYLRIALPILLSVPGAGDAAQKKSTSPLVIHVAPDGSDDNNGVTAPLRTIAHALERARVLKALPANRDRGMNITIASGTYVLNEPLKLGAADSGKPGAPMVLEARPDAVVRITGGDEIADWRKNDSAPELVASIGKKGAAVPCPEQFFVNGARRYRPRMPARGMFKFVQPTRRGEDHFITRSGDLPASFVPRPDMQIVIPNAWIVSRMRIAAYDSESRTLSLQAPVRVISNSSLSPGIRYFIDNVPARRLEAGQWQCDQEAGLLRYRPLPQERTATVSVVVPRLPSLLVVDGTEDAPVHDIEVRGITFAYSAWYLPDKGWPGRQAEAGAPAAIELSNCRNIILTGLVVTHTGAGGVGIRHNCRNVELSESSLEDLGGGGVSIGLIQREPKKGTDWAEGTSVRGPTHDIRILRNSIVGAGRVLPASPGIWSAQADHVQIRDNRISDLFYSGISIGWVWGDGPSLSHHNSITGNVIDNYGQDLLSDMGGIYTLGRQPGTEIAFNRISRGRARDYGGWGLYADEGSSGIVFHDNEISDTSSAAIHVHKAGALTFIDNRARDFALAGIRCSDDNISAKIEFVNTGLDMPSGVPVTKFCASDRYEFTNSIVVPGE